MIGHAAPAVPSFSSLSPSPDTLVKLVHLLLGQAGLARTSKELLGGMLRTDGDSGYRMPGIAEWGPPLLK